MKSRRSARNIQVSERFIVVIGSLCKAKAPSGTRARSSTKSEGPAPGAGLRRSRPCRSSGERLLHRAACLSPMIKVPLSWRRVGLDEHKQQAMRKFEERDRKSVVQGKSVD